METNGVVSGLIYGGHLHPYLMEVAILMNMTSRKPEEEFENFPLK